MGSVSCTNKHLSWFRVWMDRVILRHPCADTGGHCECDPLHHHRWPQHLAHVLGCGGFLLISCHNSPHPDGREEEKWVFTLLSRKIAWVFFLGTIKTIFLLCRDSQQKTSSEFGYGISQQEWHRLQGGWKREGCPLSYCFRMLQGFGRIKPACQFLSNFPIIFEH